jgi:catechol 2,3-dioxygenase-like lactoylglutathione lyase family enzyme
MNEFIAGIQQIGIGVKNAPESLRAYARLFGMKTLVFDDVSEASLMTRYTGGTAYRRQALLSLNLKGGGGFEIWQFQNRQPAEAPAPPRYGDLGIFAAKIKCSNVAQAQRQFAAEPSVVVSPLQADGKGDQQCWVQDGSGNVFNVVSSNHWFQKASGCLGGVTGAVIGVSNMDRAIRFYQTLLSVDSVAYDGTETLLPPFEREPRTFRRVLLQKQPCGLGAFSRLLGSIELELVECLDAPRTRIYSDRFWGDCGFIHLCFDVFDMCGLKSKLESAGYRFTVDSIDSFGMEAAAGRFCYVEDPDGTLIELVETHKVPIMKKLGLYLNLKKRNLRKPLPDWMIRLMALSKVKE